MGLHGMAAMKRALVGTLQAAMRLGFPSVHTCTWGMHATLTSAGVLGVLCQICQTRCGADEDASTRADNDVGQWCQEDQDA
jgi:hypothetical protein